MRYFYDTEFIDDGKTIRLISIGIIAEDGRELYLINSDENVIKDAIAHPWLRDNVVNSLPLRYIESQNNPGEYSFFWQTESPDFNNVMPKIMMAERIKNFVLADAQPQLWAYFAAYDHVVLSQLFGRMLNLPVGMPMWSHDLCQEIERHRNPHYPPQLEGAHNALADARWVKSTYEYLNDPQRRLQGILREE